MGKSNNTKSFSKKKLVDRDDKETTIEDPRFAAAISRPRFQKPLKDVAKVVLDERFASVLTDPRFQLQEKDRYGRRRKNKERAKEELSAFYTIEENKEEPNDDDNEKDAEDEDNNEESNVASRRKQQEEKDIEVDQDPASRIAYLRALSRGELEVSSSSSDDDEDDASASSDDENNKSDVDVTKNAAKAATAASVFESTTWKEEEIEITHEPSPFLAVLDMDWSHVRAVDIFAIMASFTPPGAVKCVRVYPSDFGMEQMAKEEKYGPTDIWKTDNSTKGKGRLLADENEEEEEEEEEDDDEEKDESVDNMSDAGLNETAVLESDFDPEKLRAYEVSKLKYYFAVVEFTSPEHANIAYKELDGQEFEHSSAAMDLRAIPPADVEGVIKNRTLRDEATSLPGNYQPPDFVINALQQTSVQCTWEDGDGDREKTLTKYGSGQVGEWGALAEQDDIRAYLASDQSSDEDDDEDSGIKKKAASKRAMLGLDSDDEQENPTKERAHQSSSSSSSSEEDASEESDDEQGSVTAVKEITYIPGAKKLEEKIRTKLRSQEETDELTPWQKYQEKRKQKKKEKRQAVRNLRKENVDAPNEDTDSDREPDDFFIDESDQHVDSTAPKSKGEHVRNVKKHDNKVGKNPKTADELELLLAGEGDEEDARNFDIRGLQRMEKNKDKKLRGSRKRKELAVISDVAGKDFKVDVRDDRFAAVLDGSDARFGIDRMDPNFKETPAMREILVEQMKRRKTKKTKRDVTPNTNAESTVAKQGDKSSGAAALSQLVKNIKNRVTKVSQ